MLRREASSGRPVREEVQQHTFGPKHGGVAGMIAVGFAFMLQGKEHKESPSSQLLWLLPLPPSGTPYLSMTPRGQCLSTFLTLEAGTMPVLA